MGDSDALYVRARIKNAEGGAYARTKGDGGPGRPLTWVVVAIRNFGNEEAETENSFNKTPIRSEYLIVDGGALAGTGAKSCQLT